MYPARVEVRIHFQETPVDVYVLIAYSIVVAGVLFVLGPDLLAILLISFVPGYLLTAALFPGMKDLGWVERLALSLGLSIAIVPLLGLALNFTPYGISFTSTIAMLAMFAILAGSIAYWRRIRLPFEDRLCASLELRVPNWKNYRSIDKILTIVLSACIVGAVGISVSVLLPLHHSDRFTEFYILGPDGTASGYPTTLNVSQTATLLLGVANHEQTNVSYTIQVDLVGLKMAFNASTQSNETIEVNRTSWSWLNLTLQDGQSSTQPYSFHIDYSGAWRIRFSLFTNVSLFSPYQQLQLTIRVL